jgi:hypothetical protein
VQLNATISPFLPLFFLKRLLLVPSSLQFVVHLLVSEEADTDR